jgi:tetratricopeptide (TPR) repeat protein
MGTTFIAYRPAWHGRPVWDDDRHMPRPELRSWHGLARIWTEPTAAPQYYPLVHSVFWVEHRLWGDATLGYHLLNVSLHVASALLLVLILRRLGVPGAWLAAAIFALHPVMVESVAWITELKNTLSGVFFLGSLLAYLRFEGDRKRPFYVIALLLFIMGLLSKSVIAILPASILVLQWWKRGSLSWRRDVAPLVPFFVLGTASGLFTAWVERKVVGAEGQEFQFTFLERGLIAGRAVWFYLGKLFWPVELKFCYPRWTISQTVWWQYLFPVSALSVAGAFWLLRRRWRAPLATLLYFAVTLFPALGFLNVYPFRFSFVADHFQYLAALGPITLVAAAGTAALDSFLPGRPLKPALCAVILSTLWVLTWQQSQTFADEETLWRTTLDRNPNSWMPHYNLANCLVDGPQLDEALGHYRRALELRPDFPDAHNNLGHALSRRGQIDEAIVEYQQACQLNPAYAEAHNNLGNALLQKGNLKDAVVQFQEALKIRPGDPRVWNNLGNGLLQSGELDMAITSFQRAVELEPGFAEAHNNLGVAHLRKQEPDAALPHFQEAIKLKHYFSEAQYNLAVVLSAQGRLDEAIKHYELALQLKPDYLEAHGNLAKVLMAQGRSQEAVAHLRTTVDLMPNSVQGHFRLGQALQAQEDFRAASAEFEQTLRLDPNHLPAHTNLAWLLATCPDAAVRNGARATDLAQQAQALPGARSSQVLDVLAAAYAEAGRFDRAIETENQALAIAAAEGNNSLTEAGAMRLKLYEAHRPYREAP